MHSLPADRPCSSSTPFQCVCCGQSGRRQIYRKSGAPSPADISKKHSVSTDINDRNAVPLSSTGRNNNSTTPSPCRRQRRLSLSWPAVLLLVSLIMDCSNSVVGAASGGGPLHLKSPPPPATEAKDCGGTSNKQHPMMAQSQEQHHHHSAAEIFTDDERYRIKSCMSPDLEMHELSTCRFYAMMNDAGSTGTRLHIFEFSHQPNSSGSPFRLQLETFHEVKPGLSNFANAPSEAVVSVSELLEHAKATVPQQSWAHTPLALKATAGLRLLPQAEADAILNALETLFEECPFLVNEDSVAVMSGVYEGIFGWFTLNFLLDRIDSVLLNPEASTTLSCRRRLTEFAPSLSTTQQRGRGCAVVSAVDALVGARSGDERRRATLT